MKKKPVKDNPYATEYMHLEEALKEIREKVDSLRVNPVKLKGQSIAAWQIEDAMKNKLFVVITGTGEAEENESEEAADLVITVESDIGQLLSFERDALKVFLEMNYMSLNLCRVSLSPDGRLVVLHRRWLQGLTVRDAFDAIAEVWNAAESLRADMKPLSPGHA